MVVDKADVKPTPGEYARNRDFISCTLKLSLITETLYDFSWGLQRVFELIYIIGEHLKSFYISGHLRPNRLSGIIARLLLGTKKFIAFRPPLQDHVPRSRWL